RALAVGLLDLVDRRLEGDAGIVQGVLVGRRTGQRGAQRLHGGEHRVGHLLEGPGPAALPVSLHTDDAVSPGLDVLVDLLQQVLSLFVVLPRVVERLWRADVIPSSGLPHSTHVDTAQNGELYLLTSLTFLAIASGFVDRARS